MNTDYRNSPQLNQEEKLLVRTMQRVRAGAGVVVLLVLVAGALFGPGERTSDLAAVPDAATQEAAPADPGLSALEGGRLA
ncbi:MAG: hypothetical protein WBA53_12590 [Burkholderiaceae bacterium]